MHYRPDIDGLRAVAVLAVVLYHAGFGCAGGYVGVDVFFVVSGFLITSLIWKDLADGAFTFSHFWERRARRIVPALIAVTLATLAAGWFLLLPREFAALARAVEYQSVFAANIYYWRTAGYFAGGEELRPMLHIWSLAVEEQFYLIAPLAFWLLYRMGRSVVVAAMVIACVLSLGVSIWGVANHPSAAFYLLPTRAWEILLGAIVVFLPVGYGFARGYISAVGMALILLPVWLYDDMTPFPGFAAVPPTLGTALIIWANQMPTRIGKLLSLRPLVFVGLISYSLYLWHWPLLSLAAYRNVVPLSASSRLALVAAGFAAAVLSWRFVEQPFRTRQFAPARVSMLATAALALLVAFVAGMLCLDGHPQRFSPQALAYAAAAEDQQFIHELSSEDIREGKLVPIGTGAGSVSLLVWGDSYAMAVMPAVDAYLTERGIGGLAATRSATPPVVDWPSGNPTLGEAVIDYIRVNNIANVLLVGDWVRYAERPGFSEAIRRTMEQISENGCRPIVLLPPPEHVHNVPRALALSVSLPTATLHTRRYGFSEGDIETIHKSGGLVIDPAPSFLDGQRYIIERNGLSLYWDGYHVSSRGALLMLLPFFREGLKVLHD